MEVDVDHVSDHEDLSAERFLSRSNWKHQFTFSA